MSGEGAGDLLNPDGGQEPEGGQGGQQGAQGGEPTPPQGGAQQGGQSGDQGNQTELNLQQGGDKITWDQIKQNIPEELKDDPTLSRITSVENLVKSYVNAQRSIGKDKVPVPDKHASEDDWKEVFKKLGNPESLDEYNVNAEPQNEEFFNEMKKAAHENGVLPWQFEKMMETFDNYGKEVSQKSEAQQKAEYDEAVGALKKEWGEAFDSNVKKANIALKEFLPNKEDRDALIQAGFGRDPKVVRLLANAAQQLSEDVFVGQGASEFSSVTPEDALKKAREIQGNPEHPYRKPDHPNHQAAKKEVADLYKIAYPE